MRIKLTTAEIIQGAIAGILRNVQNIQEGRNHLHGAKKTDGWLMHIEGALGEMALAKALGVYWSSGKRKGSDVGEYEVRTTTGANNRLILHPDDPDDSRHYLVTGHNGDYVICGWIMGRDGKQERFWADPSHKNRPAFFIDQKYLTKVTG